MRGAEPLTHDGRVRVRRGRSNDQPTPSELAELCNTFGLILTEERVLTGTGLSDLDVGSFRAWMELRGGDLHEHPLPIEEELVRAQVLERGQDGRAEATLYGLLCFGVEPQRVSPMRSFYVQLSA